jgi:hypothetical protein
MPVIPLVGESFCVTAGELLKVWLNGIESRLSDIKLIYFLEKSFLL